MEGDDGPVVINNNPSVIKGMKFVKISFSGKSRVLEEN